MRKAVRAAKASASKIVRAILLTFLVFTYLLGVAFSIDSAQIRLEWEAA
jgi:hypothetical protein